MTAQVNFYANPNSDSFNLKISGSGLGFYGNAGFGAAVAVGSWNERTYITDPNGVVQGAEAQNVKWVHPNSGVLGQTGSGISLLNIPNYQSTLEIRFTNDAAVQVENATVYIYDRYNIANPASGVTCKVAEILHPSILQTDVGSGDSSWITSTLDGAVVPISLANSPGVSGFYAGSGNSSTESSLEHSWYCAISCSPDSVGSKTNFGLYFSCEYL
jgi:hypothetical protein